MTTLIPKVDFKNGGATPTGAVNRPINEKLQEVISVKDFGALGDGTTDDTIAIQNAINYGTSVGGVVFFPTGYYRITDTLNVGAPYFDEYDFILDSAVALNLSNYVAHEVPANIAANRLLKKIDLIGEANVFLVADFTPANYEPVIAYNLDNQGSDTLGKIDSFKIIIANSVTAGVFNPYSLTSFANNNIIGLYTGRGAQSVTNVSFYGLGCGLLAAQCYWVNFTNINLSYCLTGARFSQGNAVTGLNVNNYWCDTGIIFDGQNGKLAGINAQESNTALSVLFADNCTFGPGYIEDQNATTIGEYAVKLGQEENGQNLLNCRFEGLYIGINVLSPKKAIRFFSCRTIELDTCRLNGNDYVVDTSSFGYVTNCDVAIALGQFYNNYTIESTWDVYLGDAFGNNFTYGDKTAIFSRTGNLVTASAYIEWTGKGSAGASPLVMNLPYFSSNNLKQTYSASIGTVDGVPISTQLTATLEPNAQFLSFNNIANLTTATPVAANGCSTTGKISLTISYVAAPIPFSP
jgi:hypothetical protein